MLYQRESVVYNSGNANNLWYFLQINIRSKLFYKISTYLYKVLIISNEHYLRCDFRGNSKQFPLEEKGLEKIVLLLHSIRLFWKVPSKDSKHSL